MAKNGKAKKAALSGKEMRDMLVKELDERRNKCWAELAAVLKKHNLKFQVQTALTDRILHNIMLVDASAEINPNQN